MGICVLCKTRARFAAANSASLQQGGGVAAMLVFHRLRNIMRTALIALFPSAPQGGRLWGELDVCPLAEVAYGCD
jgi:hypothetical protein